VSPILVRPVREQLEHDRVIRLLQVKLKRKHEVIANIGEDQTTSVKIGQLQIFPDLVLTSADRARKLLGTVEVETSESVNHLEARSQWAHLGRARAPFHLYVPLGSVDIARRLANENQVNVSEIWSFHTIGDQTHFRLVHRAPEDTRRSNEPRGIVTTVPGRGDVPALPARPAPPVKTAAPPAPAPVKRPAAPARSAKPAKPVKKRVAPPVRKAKSASASRSAASSRKSAPARSQKRK
jgi:hypothetical protein